MIRLGVLVICAAIIALCWKIVDSEADNALLYIITILAISQNLAVEVLKSLNSKRNHTPERDNNKDGGDKEGK